jgi:NAD(P)-dependent dehydrogenase (short-subunit alcohol dehydrogenase family)
MILERFRVDGRLALITGAGSGLGRQFALTLAEAGATVALAARRREKLEETAEAVRDIGGAALCLDLDVADSRSVGACLAELDERAGPADILINNAGIARQAFATDLTETDWDAVIDTNLKGVFMMAQAVARTMIKAGKGGSIVNVASILGLRVAKGLAAYNVSKAGVIHLTKTLALEFSRYGIRVNALAPGYFVTEINQAEFEQGAAELIRKRVPMGRVGDIEEIGGPMLLLASEAGGYMTGSIVEVDGGHLCASL